MDFELRDAKEEDFNAILRLNHAFSHFTSDLELSLLTQMHRQSSYHKIAYTSRKMVGFLLVFEQASEYSSDNFLWFKNRYSQFLYIDRIVIDESAQGFGVARAMYYDLFTFAGNSRICCEYNLMPANLGSAKFHRKLGFHQVGERQVGSTKVLSMQLKNLDQQAS